MPTARRILHPTDFSPASRAAFRKAMDLARTLRRELVLVHVLAPVIGPMMPDGYIPPATYDDLQTAARAMATRHLDRLAVQARRAKVRVSSRLVEGVPVHDRIVRTAKAVRAEVIVMGTHGRSGVSRVFLGSVAARVVATAPCPVLTVRGR
jgi:nucleotide-binding universal stress UspA family protein